MLCVCVCVVAVVVVVVVVLLFVCFVVIFNLFALSGSSFIPWPVSVLSHFSHVFFVFVRSSF